MKLSKIKMVIVSSLLVSNMAFAAQTSTYTPETGYTKAESTKLVSGFDLGNYQLGEDVDVARYTYLNMSEFFKQAYISREGAVSELVTQLNPKIGEIKAEVHGAEMTLDEWTKNHLDGVLVIHKGKVVYEKYPRMRATDKHVWWSISKSVVGTLVAQLEEEGKVDVNKAIETYIPELAKSDWAGTRVIDILDMASGMSGLEADDPEAYTNPESPYGLFESSLEVVANTPKTMKSAYDYIATLERLKPAATKHEYTSVNTFVLAWLVEKITGERYAKAMQQRIWSHIGAESDAMLSVSSTGAPAAHGLISSTLRDLGRYGMQFTPSWGVVSDKQVVSDAVVKRFQTAGRPEILDSGMIKDYFNSYALGDAVSTTYQWDYVTNDGDFAKSGYHGQTLYVSPSKDLVVVSFATKETYDTFKFARVFAKSLEK